MGRCLGRARKKGRAWLRRPCSLEHARGRAACRARCAPGRTARAHLGQISAPPAGQGQTTQCISSLSWRGIAQQAHRLTLVRSVWLPAAFPRALAFLSVRNPLGHWRSGPWPAPSVCRELRAANLGPPAAATCVACCTCVLFAAVHAVSIHAVSFSLGRARREACRRARPGSGIPRCGWPQCGG